MESAFEQTTTNRGAPAIIYQNQKYRKRYSNTNGSEIWVCCNKKCGISILLDKNNIKRFPKEHCHAELSTTTEVQNILEQLYDETKTDLIKPVKQIYQQHVKQQKRKRGTAEDIPIFDKIRSTAYRRRASVLPPVPRSLEEIVIPDKLKHAENGEKFVIFDNPAPQRLITLSSSKALLALSKTSYWFADGTFRSAPQKFNQSYSIHGLTDYGIHPFVHVAMCDRKQEQYELVLQGLLDYSTKNNIALQPISIMLDFELAAANALLAVFKSSSVVYCHFHFCQSIWRYIQKSGLTSSFKNKDAKRQLANLFGLPLIPLQHVYTCFETIASELTLIVPDVQKLLQYFSSTYLYGNRFPPYRWNHFSSIGLTHRTNNAIEGFHRSINSHNITHPNIWKYILLKRDLDEETNIIVSQEMNQQRSTKNQRKRYRDHDNNILEAKNLLNIKEINLVEYQRRIRILTYRYINSNENKNDDNDIHE